MATKTIAMDAKTERGTCADAVREAAAVWGKIEGSKTEAEKIESVIRSYRRSAQRDVEEP